MIASVTLVVCIAAIVYLAMLQRRRTRRSLEDTARLRTLQRWRNVLEEDADPGESFAEYQERKQVPRERTSRELAPRIHAGNR
jgi:hypothetical protein